MTRWTCTTCGANYTGPLCPNKQPPRPGERGGRPGIALETGFRRRRVKVVIKPGPSGYRLNLARTANGEDERQ